LSRQENDVNDVDDTIRCFNVSDDYLHGVVQEDLAIFDGDGDICAKHGGGSGQRRLKKRAFSLNPNSPARPPGSFLPARAFVSFLLRAGL
jgi:hypothetical protein